MRVIQQNYQNLPKYWEFYTTPKAALVQKSSIINIYNVLALPLLLCRREIWTLRENDKNIDIFRDEISEKSCRIHRC